MQMWEISVRDVFRTHKTYEILSFLRLKLILQQELKKMKITKRETEVMWSKTKEMMKKMNRGNRLNKIDATLCKLF